MLVDWLAKRHGAKNGTLVKNVASLILDLCNDLGVCVPITCCDQGTIFRAYRHGENVRFTDAELALAWHLTSGYQDARGRPDVPRLVLEKMLVLLFRVGVTRRFLEPLYGISGTDGVAKVEFDLKGARPIIEKGARCRSDRKTWLADYLVKRRVLGVNKASGSSTGTYFAKECPVGNFLVGHADTEATELGEIIGLLMKKPDTLPLPLAEEDLMLMATCATPTSTAKALQTELDIFQNWYEETFDAILRGTRWDSTDSVRTCLDSLINGDGHEALHSARLKFTGYRKDAIFAIYQRCYNSLNANPATRIYGRRWKTFWPDLDQGRRDAEKKHCDPLINKAGELVLTAVACLSAIEIALAFQYNALANPKRQTRHIGNALRKLREFRIAMHEHGVEEPQLVARIGDRFEEIAALREDSNQSGSAATLLLGNVRGTEPNFEPKQAADFAQKKISELSFPIMRHVELMDALLEHRGLLADNYRMSYILYYDLFDSTATRAKGDVQAYRARVDQFRNLINGWVRKAETKMNEDNSRIFCQNGNRTSTNDSKQIFFGGLSALVWLKHAIIHLVETADAFGSIHVRMIAVPCDFAGSTAYLEDLNTEVQGRRFWEYYSRLQKGIEVLEKKHSPNGLQASFLAMATDVLKTEIDLPAQLQWQVETQIVRGEIEQLGKETIVHFGSISTSHR